MAEGPGFEPGTPISQGNRLAGGRTRPLCDPSNVASKPQVFIVPVCEQRFYWRAEKSDENDLVQELLNIIKSGSFKIFLI